jgi:hypothetical protein
VENSVDHYTALTAKNNNGEMAIDVVSGKWDQGLADFYTGINQKLDLKQIEKERPKMAERLRNRYEEKKETSQPPTL